jgi:SAM-dependent methyltransferase
MAATADIQDTTTAGEFGDRVFADLTGTITIVMAALGDRLGLFKALHRHGPLASAELANVAGVDERYTREWLNGMTCAGYLEVKEDRFSLPAAHVAVLADEGGADFMGGPLQEAPALIGTYENLVDAFRRGGGVHQAAYHPGIWEGMQRESAGIYNTMLIQEWIPAIPEVQSRLEAGTTLADVGCGSGLALIRLAQAFPESRFDGFDNFPVQVERARANVAAEGLADRIRIDVADGLDGGDDRFGVVTSFDVVHDAADPLALLRSIRDALQPGGHYVMAEPNAGESLEDNIGPVGTFLIWREPALLHDHEPRGWRRGAGHGRLAGIEGSLPGGGSRVLVGEADRGVASAVRALRAACLSPGDTRTASPLGWPCALCRESRGYPK